MNKNIKYVFLLATIVFLLVSVTAISAENTTSKDITDKATTVTAEKSVDTQKVANTNKNIVKTEKVNKTTKAEPQTHVVNQDNVDDIFGGTKYGLSDSINEGDTLDFQGTIDKNHSLVINKPITVISSTEDAVISLHTKSGSLLGDDPGNMFTINKGASNSFISGLKLYNTECWVYNVYNTTLYNMTMFVQNASVGGGVGQTSLRYSNNLTMDSCYIYTENNGGSSSFVWTGCNDCTIVNSTIEAQGSVGNLVYIGNPYNINDIPEGYVMGAVNNKVINCTILGGSGGISNPIQNMANYTLIKGNKLYAGGSASSGNNGTIEDNEFYNTVSLTLTADTTATNNTFFGTGSVTVQARSKVFNNTFNKVTVSGANTTIEGNTFNDLLTVNQPANIENNLLNKITIAANGKGSNITYNTITGNITSAGANVTIANNDITTDTEIAIKVTGASNTIVNNTIYSTSKTGNAAVEATATSTVADNQPEMPGEIILTDETYSEFFDMDAYAIVEKIPDYSTVILTGTFNNRQFKFKNITVNINSDNALLNNGTIIAEDTANVIIDGIIFNNSKDVENTVIFDSDNNIIRNSKITKNSDGINNAREILIYGDNNLVQYVDINISGHSQTIDYSSVLPVTPITGILILGDANIVEYNNITFHELGEVGDIYSPHGSADLITLTGGPAGEARNNIIRRNVLKAPDADGYLYAINIGKNGNYNDVSYNDIIVKAGYYAYGVQNLEGPVYGNNITYNNMNLTAESVAYGVFANIWSYETGAKFGDYNIKYNNINVTSVDAYGIQLAGSDYYEMPFVNANITYNKFIIEGTYAMGIGLYKTNNMYLYYNNYTINGQTSEPDTSSWDTVTPRTVGIYNEKANYTRISNERGCNVKNGPSIILKDIANSSVSSGLAYVSDMINVILENATYVNVTSTILNSTGEYGVEIINSSSVRVASNTIDAAESEIDGNSRILVDDNSENITISSNKPFGGVLTFITDSALYGQDLNITVSIKTSDGKVINQGNVDFYIEGVLNVVAITNGTATYEYGPVEELNDIVVAAQYEGNSTTPKSLLVEQVIKVIRESEVEPLSDDLVLGDNTIIRAAFYDEDNQPLEHGTVILRVNGKTLRNPDGSVDYQYTDENGVVDFSAYLDGEWLKPDTTIQAIYIGDEEYDPIIVERKVQVTKPTADIVVTAPENAKAGDTITLSASVTCDEDAVDSGRVAFKLNGKTLKDESGKALYVNVEDGVASTEYTIPVKTKANTYTITAVFTDSLYERCEDETEITISK